MTPREHPRYAHEAALTILAGGALVEGRTQNLSRGGLCATLSEPVAVGTPVDLDIVLVFEGDVRSEPLHVSAHVVWCTDVDDGHQIGIAFRPLDAEQTDYLGLFIKHLEGGATRERTQRDLAVDDRFR